MTGDDIHRREARATFHRAVAYIANLVESRDANETDKPYSTLLLNDPEMVADLAILATLGPPRAEGEAAPFDPEGMTEEEVAAAPADHLPSAMRDIKVAAIAYEILGEVERYASEHPGEEGWATDPEVRACQTAVQLTREQYGDDSSPTQQESWDLVVRYLGNHDDGVWMLFEPDDDDEDGDT